MMKRNSVIFFVVITLFFSPSKKNVHRIKRERAVKATKNARSSVSSSKTFAIIFEKQLISKR